MLYLSATHVHYSSAQIS